MIDIFIIFGNFSYLLSALYLLINLLIKIPKNFPCLYFGRLVSCLPINLLFDELKIRPSFELILPKYNISECFILFITLKVTEILPVSPVYLIIYIDYLL